MMAAQRRHHIPAIIVLVLCVVAYASFRTEFRLRDAMPREFFDASQLPPNRRDSEEKLAHAYWACAVTQIQWQYGYARRLPDQPPEEFVLTKAQGGPLADDALSRKRHWQRLRAIWDVSDVWDKKYEFNADVFRQSAQSAGVWLERLIHKVTGFS